VDASTGATARLGRYGRIFPTPFARTVRTPLVLLNFGIGRVLHVDQQSGAQTIVAEGGNLIGPVGITVDTNGDLLVGDPYTINPASLNLYDGGVVRISAATGGQTLVCRGEGNHVNPLGLAVGPARQD
jgi:hypothetical protein